MDNVLSQLANSTAAEVRQMSKLQKIRPQMLEEIEMILAKLKAALETIECFMKIVYERPESGSEMLIPKVVDIISSAPVLERILSNKLIAENI